MLKELVSIESTLDTVKPQFLVIPIWILELFSRIAMDFLLKLDSIQEIITQLCSFLAHLYNFTRFVCRLVVR